MDKTQTEERSNSDRAVLMTTFLKRVVSCATKCLKDDSDVSHTRAYKNQKSSKDRKRFTKRYTLYMVTCSALNSTKIIAQ